MRYYREINDFFREHGHEYDIIWDNECMFNDMTPLKKAAEVGIPVRIAHCHNPQNMDKSVIGHVPPSRQPPFPQPLRQRPLGVLDGEREVGVPCHGFALRGHPERH